MTGWAPFFARVTPEALALALGMLRVLPLAFLCPLLGGPLVLVAVRLAVALSLALVVRPLVGPVESLDALFLGRCAREAAFGVSLGVVAALPFDAARIGGRLVDLFRGTSAEAALPVAGHRESASGDLLYQLLLSTALCSGALPALLRAIGRTYLLVPPGRPMLLAPEAVALWMGVAMATGVAVAAPVLVLCWAVDGALGLVTRVAPGIPLSEVGPPGRILGGAGLLWIALGGICDRLLAAVAAIPDAWTSLVGGVR